MITIKSLTLQLQIPEISELDLSVPAGKTYVLLSAGERINRYLINIFLRLENRYQGRVMLSGNALRETDNPLHSDFALIDRDSEWPTALRIGDIMAFLRKTSQVAMEDFEELKLTMNLDRMRNRRMVDFPEPEKRRLFFSFQRLRNVQDYLIHDIARGMPVDFVLWFKEQLRSLKSEGKSILYLSNDVFFAPEIGDVVGFMKKGKLLLELKGAKVKRMDLKELYFRFLSEE